MSGPWEEYQRPAPAIAAPAGPWEQYRSAQAPWPEAEGPSILERIKAVAEKYGPKAVKAVDDTVRSLASGATFGLADELAAYGASQTGIGKQPGAGADYESNLAAERARDKQIPALIKIPGEIAGGVMTGTGLARVGLTALNAAAPTVGGMAARGAGEAAAYGAAYGAGNAEGDLKDRARAAVIGALTAAPFGAASGSVAGSVAEGNIPKPPTTKQLQSSGTAAYDQAKASGVQLTQKAWDDIADDIAAKAKNLAIDPTIHPKATAAVKRITDAKGGTPSIQDIDLLRRVISAAAGSTDADERRIAKGLRDALDDSIGKLTNADVLAGDPKAAAATLAEARGLWETFKKSEVIDDIMKRVELRASQFSGSGKENAIRTEFRQLAMNEKKMRGFTDAEREAIREVVKGGPVGNFLRMIGKAAPTGIVSASLGAGAGAYVGGPIGAAAVPAIGMGARQGATAMTERNARIASELIRRGGLQPPAPPLTPTQQTILRAILASSGRGAAEAPDMIPRDYP